MKSFDKFEKFQLGKSEMNKVNGGFSCTVHWSDGFRQSYSGNHLTVQEAYRSLQKAYGGDAFIVCKE